MAGGAERELAGVLRPVRGGQDPSVYRGLRPGGVPAAAGRGVYALGPALRELRAEPEAAPRLLGRYKEAPLLYVDDLFKGRRDLPISDWELRLAFELLDYRYGCKLPTILSTERSFPELVSLDEAIAGRLKERCGRFLINVTPEPGKNFRFRGEG